MGGVLDKVGEERLIWSFSKSLRAFRRREGDKIPVSPERKKPEKPEDSILVPLGVQVNFLLLQTGDNLQQPIRAQQKKKTI